MEAATAEDPQTLVAQLAEARDKLEGLVSARRALDAELEALAPEREQHRRLQDVCRALDELGATGAGALFWDETAAAVRDDHMRGVQARLESFQRRVDEIEGRRLALVEEIKRQQYHTDGLEDDAFEAQEEEQRRQQEWIIEREISAIRSREPMMPWLRGGEDDRRYRRSLATALVISLLGVLILPLIHLPVRAPDAVIDVPERVVSMMTETEAPPPAPPREEPRPQPRERLAEQKVPDKPVPQRTAPPAEQEPRPSDAVVPPQGLLAFRDKLAALKQAPVAAELGLQARIDAAEDPAARPERSMLTTNAPGSSGGIKLAALSRNFGKGGIGERGTIQGAALTRASSGIKAIAPAQRPVSGGPGLSRTDEEIQIVFDRYKAALYRLYNRELRQDPTLQGKMVLRLTIEPDGSVSFCQLQSTDMNAPQLSAQVVDRVKTFNFGAKDVPPITIVYPIDFLPAA